MLYLVMSRHFAEKHFKKLKSQILWSAAVTHVAKNVGKGKINAEAASSSSTKKLVVNDMVQHSRLEISTT